MSAITTHVLDCVSGKPASGIPVTLEYQSPEGNWEVIAQKQTGANGRVRDFLPDGQSLRPGLYSLRFDTSGLSAFFPEVVLRFRVDDPAQRFHVPLLLSAFGFTAYRGS